MRASIQKIFRDAVPNPWLNLPLQTTLVAERANGCVGAAQLSLPAYTRASTAYVEQYDGLKTLVLSGETRMQGARRSANLLATTSEDVSNAAWSKVSDGVTAIPSVGAAITGPTGTTNAYPVTWPAVSGAAKYSGLGVPAFTAVAAHLYTPTIYLRNRAGASTIYIYGYVSGYTHVTALAITTSWQRFNVPAAAFNAGGSARFYLGCDTNNATMAGGISAQTVDVAMAQAEDVTGQTNQLPGEYVSVGVLSAPYHGLGIDGTKAFNTTNGNSVASNIVTEAAGVPIVTGAAGVAATAPVDAGGPFGYLSEGARTNLALQSQTLGTTWAPGNVLDSDVTSDVAVAPDGTTTADKVRELATTAAHYILQTINTTAVPHTFSAYFKAAERSKVWVYTIAAGTAIAYFDLSAGTVGTVSGTLSPTATITALPNGWYRCTVTVTYAGAAATPWGFGPTTTDNVLSYAGTATYGIYAWGAQLEVASFASSYIPTTTVAVTKAASVDQYVSAGNLPTNDFTLYGEVIWPEVQPAGNYFLFGSYVDASNYTAVLWDGTNLIARKRIAGVNTDATKALTPTANTRIKWAARFSSTSGIDIFHTGAIGTNNPTTTAAQIGTNFQIGADGNGANQPYASVPNVRIYPVALSSGKLTAMTTS